VDIGRSFSYQFEDKQWLSKLGICAVVLFVPILNFAASGYLIGIMRNVMERSAEPLPNWDDLEKKFIDGLIIVVARLIYLLPFIIIFIPIGVIVFSALASGNHNFQDISKLIAGVGSVLFYCLLCVIMIYGMALSIIFPAIEVIFSRERTFASCFKFRETFDLISRNPGPFLTAWGVFVAAALVYGFAIGTVNVVIGWIPCFGWIASLVISAGSAIYLLTVNAYLFGQFGATAFGKDQPVG
jgi:hypothetical protein